MPPRSKIIDLPDDLRDELNERLINNGFSNYVALSEWLNAELEQRDMELRVSKNAVWRHGEKFEERLSSLKMATEQAKALTEAAPDDEGAMSDALIRMVQEKIFNILVNVGTDDVKKINLANLTKSIAQLTRATVRQKEWMVEIREKLEKSKASTAEEAAGFAVKAGLSDEDADILKAKILGIDIDARN
tara:strand:- start:5277 stop:5843 length:567 start_codon:yes stop_codon:yes gene_type:complete